jgi:ATP-dependent DNA ligase
MTLPLSRKYHPMEARPATELPAGAEWQYEPKWDGFRCLAFRDAERVDLQSKSGKPLTRYFPELIAALKALKSNKFVLDGEIVIPVGGSLSFDDLLMRIHPAASRILKLSQQSPCVFIVFDLLVDEKGRSLANLPLRDRRKALQAFVHKYLDEGRHYPFVTDHGRHRHCTQVVSYGRRAWTGLWPNAWTFPINRASAPVCRRSKSKENRGLRGWRISLPGKEAACRLLAARSVQ